MATRVREKSLARKQNADKRPKAVAKYIRLNKADLVVSEAFADGGPILKRFQPVSKGRAHEIKKRTSHITVILDEAKA